MHAVVVPRSRIDTNPRWRGWLRHLVFPGVVTGILVGAGLPWLVAPLVLSVAFLLVVSASAVFDLPDHPGMTPELLRYMHWLLMVATWTIVFFTVRDRHVQLGFYATVAQIAPVLLLALVVDAGFSARSREERPIVALIALTVVFATAASLVPLASGNPDDGHFGTVVAGLAAATVGLCARAVFRTGDRR